MKTQKQTIIHIHGAGPKHYRSLADGSGDWQAKLSTNLGHRFKVISPEMPSPKNPDYEEWKVLLEKKLLRVQTEIIFVAHSLGGSFILKYLCENPMAQKISGLFLVAVPFNTMKGFEVPRDVRQLRAIKNIHFYHSVDDVEVPYAHALIYQEKLKSSLKTFSDCGHFFKRRDFTEIVSDIQQLANAPEEFTEPDR